MADPIVIITFYDFTPLPDYEKIQAPLLDFCNQHDLKGTILLAEEGINSTISGTREHIDALIMHLKEDLQFKHLSWKESYYQDRPFKKMKVRLKKEAVRFAQDHLDMTKRGEYVDPKAWDDFIAREDVALIDTRNEYETRIGMFEGAIDPDTKNFRDFAAWAEQWSKDKPKDTLKVAMYCTGGIRCEKSTAYMKALGFEHVYHLRGGILQYFEDTGNAQGKWQGECFVFDDRAAVDASLKPTGRLRCKKCSAAVNADDLKHGPKGKVWCSECIAQANATNTDSAQTDQALYN